MKALNRSVLKNKNQSKNSKLQGFGLKSNQAGKSLIQSKKAAAQSKTVKLAASQDRSQSKKNSASFGLSLDQLRLIHQNMLKSRILEERLIKIYKAGESFFWIGAPGEEAWGVSLGLLAHKGRGPEFDYFHLHYRGTPTLVALGMEMIDSIRLMMNRATDPCTGGRNFSNHYCFPQWNVVPVSSPIEVQYGTALGTALIQKQKKTNGITIVTGGDAGTAEGDFASCLIWSSRKGSELPMLITVQNNKWGISTSFDGQHGESNIADRAKAFNIRSRVLNGLDPVESFRVVEEEMNWIRKSGRPSFIEAHVTRLYGHSSASGANFVSNEVDPLAIFQEKLLKAGVIKAQELKDEVAKFEKEASLAQEQARQEAQPTSESIWEHVFVNNENADWRKF